jgi:hypothetical protein
MNSTTTFFFCSLSLTDTPNSLPKVLQINPGPLLSFNSKLSFPGFPAPCDRHY